ncbi:hypothetical protein FSP39_018068 [Pinctada imbricata]|uniref:HSF-type DNA-binding domain-containing protein n=1 Tax=Pinctada imbricata TaxID=66713 RepID=A0AA88YIZ1_PINIB|nr:hypothetical protein FSP39_018068 [Pinctada imbricata]
MSLFDRSSKRTGRLRLSMDPKDRFPEKLYDVANDGYLVSWNGPGTAVCANEEEFEENVMDCYPGFVQISSFANFRRLFREYGFDWSFDSEQNVFEFSHCCFVYGKRDLLENIQTRRKSFSKPVRQASEFQKRVVELASMDIDDEKEGKTRRYLTRTRTGSTKPRKYYSARFTEESLHNSKEDSSSPGVQIHDSFSDCDSDNAHDYGSHKVCKLDSADFNHRATDIMKMLIKNEFTFDDFSAWASLNPHYFTDLQEAAYLPRNMIPCGSCSCCAAYQTTGSSGYDVTINSEFSSPYFDEDSS